MNTDINDQDLNDLYQEYWKVHADMLAKHDPAAIAGVLVAQALTIYKTILDDDQFNLMLDTISDNREEVKSLDLKKGPLH